MQKVSGVLQEHGLMTANAPMILPARLAGEIASSCLHSEILRFEWGSQYFCDMPISVFWRVPNSSDMVAQTSSWAIVAANYSRIADYSDELLDSDTIDSHYIDKVFFGHLSKESIHLVRDSDEMTFLSLTAESDLTYFPLEARPINQIPVFGEYNGISDLRRFIHSDVLDGFRRWAYTLPCHYHGREITSAAKKIARKSRRTVVRAAGQPKWDEWMVRRLSPLLMIPDDRAGGSKWLLFAIGRKVGSHLLLWCLLSIKRTGADDSISLPPRKRGHGWMLPATMRKAGRHLLARHFGSADRHLAGEVPLLATVRKAANHLLAWCMTFARPTRTDHPLLPVRRLMVRLQNRMVGLPGR
jgi:hypothetical protein